MKGGGGRWRSRRCCECEWAAREVIGNGLVIDRQQLIFILYFPLSMLWELRLPSAIANMDIVVSTSHLLPFFISTLFLTYLKY